ncbi:MAG: T9SS type A sorting domain-containing protein, partial [Bacteroidota bacterium]
SHFEFLCYAEGDSVLHPAGSGCALNVSIQDALHKPVVSVYPNPAGNAMHIASSGLEFTKVELADISGRIVYSGSSASIDVSGLSQGIYLLRISSSKGRVVKKVQIFR